jgi:hypothetical protein
MKQAAAVMKNQEVYFKTCQTTSIFLDLPSGSGPSNKPYKLKSKWLTSQRLMTKPSQLSNKLDKNSKRLSTK